MRFLPDDRGQSIQIGAVLLFAVLIILLALWQAFIVPNQNEEIEFNHNEDLQQQMTELRSTTNSMPDARTTQSVTLDLGVRYPSRSIFRNPPPARGTIRTVGGPDGQMTVTIANATALDREGETRDFWNGSRAAYDTKSIQYQPGYNEYSNAPQTIYEHSVLFNEFETEQQDLALSGQSLVRDDRLTLVTVNGSLSESRVDSTSLDLEPLSTETEVVEVEPDGGPITLELPTRLSEGEWRELFEGVRTVDPSDVTVDDSAFPDEDLGMLQVSLAQTDGNGNTQTYELRLAKIGLGTGTSDTDAEYVTDVAGDDSVIQRGQTQTLTVEVRDRFNKPLSGVAVNASAEGGEFADGSDNTTVTTGTDGEATLQYSGQVVGTNAVNVTIEEGYQPLPAEDHDATTPTNLTMDVTVERAPSGGGGGDGAYNVSWDGDAIESEDGIQSRSGDSFEYDAAQGGELTLPMFTDPVADGADVEYAVGNQLRGVVDPTAGTTDANGRDSTTFEARRTGEVNVFTSSGSGGDRITIDILDVDLGQLDVDPNVANASAVHNWSFNDVPFRGEVDNITASYPAGTSFDRLNQDDITVFLTSPGDDNIRVNNKDYSGTEATFDLDGSYNTEINGPAYVKIDGLENPAPGNYTATLTFRGAEDELPIEKDFQIVEPGKNLTLSAANGQIQPGESNTIDVLLEDETGTAIQNEDVDLSVTSGDGTFANNGTQSVTVTTNSTGQATVTYDSVSSDQGTTVQINGQLAADASVSDSATFDVIGSPGLTDVAVTDVIPTADAQTQAFRFTINESTLSGGETVTIDLSDAQTGPVSYQNENARIVQGGGSIDNFDASASELVYLAPSGGEATGTQVEIWVDNLVVDQASGGPFDVAFNRSDTVEDISASFDVTRTGRDVALTNVSVSDLVGTTAQDQTIQFTPDGAFGSEERVSIDLSDAQAGTVDYGTVQNVAVTQGSAESVDLVVDQANDIAYLTYSSPASTTTNEQIEITLEGVEPSATGDTYETGVSRGSAGSTNPSFDVLAPANFQVNITGTNSPVMAGDPLNVTADIENTGQATDTQTIELLDFGGAVVDTMQVTLAGGETSTVDLTWQTQDGDSGTDNVTVSSDNDTANEEVTVNSQVLQPVESDGVTGGSQLTFTIENVGSSQVTVETFSIDATGVANNVRLNNGDSPELGILRSTQEGEANRQGQGNNPSTRFEADGTTYDLVGDSTGQAGQYAEIAATDDDVTVDFRGFDTTFNNVQYTTAANADIVVTLGLSDGSVQTYYFQVS